MTKQFQLKPCYLYEIPMDSKFLYWQDDILLLIRLMVNISYTCTLRLENDRKIC